MNKLNIFSDTGTYELFFSNNWDGIAASIENCSAVIIDQKVYNLYENVLPLENKKVIKIEVSESIKTPQTSLDICEELILAGVTRDSVIVAIGGGVIQDLVTFAASIYMRGIDWILYPTTLLAQADSCIGGKSSINFKTWKNILGNFYVPKQIYVISQFLKTLPENEIRSGIGEILKVFMLSGSVAMELLIKEMNLYQKDPAVMDRMIVKALELKNNILEIDALDQGVRLKMNYGHSFGHALEAATNFLVPHGIAVTIGLDVANYFALQTGYITQENFDKLHATLFLNLENKDYVEFKLSDLILALEKDKKNKKGQYGLIIPVAEGEVELKFFPMNDNTNQLIGNYFDRYYGN